MKIHSALAPLALVALLGGCATNEPPQVAQFDRSAELGGIPRGTLAIDGESFVTGRAASASAYNQAVRNELGALGYSPVAGDAEFIAEIDVRQGQQEGPSGTSVGVGGGSYGGDVGIGGGISFPIGKRVRTFTELEVRLKRASDGLVIWEGRAQQEVRGEPDPDMLARELAGALFADFPPR
jgi:hypothetical protein